MDNNSNDIETLKANYKAKEFSSKQEKALRKKVQKIIRRREKEEQAIKRAEMERLYELNSYA